MDLDAVTRFAPISVVPGDAGNAGDKVPFEIERKERSSGGVGSELALGEGFIEGNDERVINAGYPQRASTIELRKGESARQFELIVQTSQARLDDIPDHHITGTHEDTREIFELTRPLPLPTEGA